MANRAFTHTRLRPYNNRAYQGTSNIPSDYLSRQEYGDQDIPDSEKDLIDSDLIVLLSEFYEDRETFEKIHFDPENIFPPELDRTIANRLREEEKQTSIRPDDSVQFRPKPIDDQKNEPKNEPNDEPNCTDLYLSFKHLANNKPTEFDWMLEKQNDESNYHCNPNPEQRFQRISATEEWVSFSKNNDSGFDFTKTDKNNESRDGYFNLLFHDSNNNSSNNDCYLNLLFNNSSNNGTVLTDENSLHAASVLQDTQEITPPVGYQSSSAMSKPAENLCDNLS